MGDATGEHLLDFSASSDEEDTGRQKERTIAIDAVTRTRRSRDREEEPQVKKGKADAEEQTKSDDGIRTPTETHLLPPVDADADATTEGANSGANSDNSGPNRFTRTFPATPNSAA